MGIGKLRVYERANFRRGWLSSSSGTTVVSGFGFWVSGFGFRVSGFGVRVYGHEQALSRVAPNRGGWAG